MFGTKVGEQVPKAYKDLEQPLPLCQGPGGFQTSPPWYGAMRSAGDNAILCPTRELLNEVHKKPGSGQAWWYFFTHAPKCSINEDPDQLPYEGAFHGAEVPYVFGDPFELCSDGERVLSKTMGCYWTNFAATGNPNEGPSGCLKKLALPAWPAFEQGDALEFRVGQLRNRTNLKKAQCDIFSGRTSDDSG